MNADKPDELTQYLDALDREDCYRIDRVLKESPSEVTQQVSFVGANGSSGRPLVRKYIKRDSGLGTAYERIFAAQQSGQRFKHIPDILECYLRDDDLVVIMELVRGETLKDTVHELGPSMDLALDVFPRLCDAVLELHEDFSPPIIHRDLKPSNIMLTQNGLAIIDYGIAREYREGARSDTMRFGTREFAPPEQFGFGQTTVRSDIYALGMILYYLITETVPEAQDTLSRFTDERVPPNVRSVIEQATAFDPADRFASVRALKAAFLSAITGTIPLSGSAHPSTEAPNAPNDATQSQTNATGAVAAKPSALIGEKFKLLGQIWNVLVAMALLVLLAACISTFVTPPATNEWPPWCNAIGYLLAMPAFLTATAWVLIDKRRLKQRFPKLSNYRIGHGILIFLIAFGALVVIVGLLDLAAGTLG